MSIRLLTPANHHSSSCGVSSAEMGSSVITPGIKQASTPPAESITAPRSEEGRIPRVRLDVDNISHVMAAHLATCLLGHVLFLKNQVPFPVMQLARVRGSSSNIKATKKRTELLNSLDTLSSHLSTTFTALSTALAPALASNRDATDDSTIRGNKACAYLAFLVGPSAGSAKSRVIFAVDGLEVKIWGESDDRESDIETDEESGNGSNTDDSDDDDDDGSECNSEEQDVPESEEEADEILSEGAGDAESRSNACSQLVPPNRPREYEKSTPSPSQADEHQALRNAERMLSRTLANAESEGLGMGAELSPTQTHILLRAPRRFVHPAWMPRQNMCITLDGMLHTFLHASGLSPEVDSRSRKKQKAGLDVEGVWVGCRDGENRIDSEQGKHESDEMIWWSWDGKIVGFSDW